MRNTNAIIGNGGTVFDKDVIIEGNGGIEGWGGLTVDTGSII